MAPTLALLGAGPVLGLALARRFGREGFRVALVARTGATLDDLTARLAADGVEAVGFTADVYDRDRIAAVTEEITARFGRIDVVAFSPGGGTADVGIASALDVTPDNLRPLLDRFVLTAVALVRAVLPAMTARGDGTILFTGGQSGLHPTPHLGNMGMAQAALRNYAHTLHSALAAKGVHVGVVNIGALIEGSVPHVALTSAPGRLDFTPEVIGPEAVAEHYWDLHVRRDRPESLVGDLGR
ncbi:SDR family NAD(P)-dependent oxidoreductase [Actinosynnema sp. NPDC020468]|uniref:SDR family NAD(P)-dependent oxidoreductase n=1 Tax=Actinosynnema sp. NPDC020468 TaxID=3154488 RepID=UPI0033EF69DC